VAYKGARWGGAKLCRGSWGVFGGEGDALNADETKSHFAIRSRKEARRLPHWCIVAIRGELLRGLSGELVPHNAGAEVSRPSLRHDRATIRVPTVLK